MIRTAISPRLAIKTLWKGQRERELFDLNKRLAILNPLLVID